MRFRTALVLAGVWLALPGIAAADQASEAALEARVKALEQQVAVLEARLNVVASRQAPPPAAAGTAGGEVASAAPAAPAPEPPRWTDASNWSAIKIGLGWSQVKALLGPAGRVTTGVFGDVWYYPDDSGGRVIFDRDGRVAEWNAPSGH